MGVNRAYRNYLNQKQGDGFEEMIQNSMYMYTQMGIMSWQNNQKVIVERTGKKITGAYFKAKSILDFSCLLDDLTYVEFDAKTTEKPRFPLQNILEHQEKRLGELHAKGVPSFLIIQLPCGLYRLGYPRIIDRSKPRTVGADEMYKIGMGYGLTIKYLDGIGRW